MPVRQEYDASIEKQVFVYENMTCVGENHFEDPRRLEEGEFTVLTNVDISEPGVRRKRGAMVTWFTPGVHATNTAMYGWVYGGIEHLMVARNSTVWNITGSAAFTVCVGAAIDTTGTCFMVSGGGVLWIVDAAGKLFYTDGTTITSVGILDAGGNALGAIQDLVFFLNRLWFAVGDYVYFSNVVGTTAVATTDLSTITSLPLAVLVGNGATVRRLMTYRSGLLMIFKYGTTGASGSIHLADVSSNIPQYFSLNVLPQFEGINICSPRTVVRAGFDQNTEIVFGSVEGLRTEQFTALDKLVNPSLPFSKYEDDNVIGINSSAYDAAICAFYNDELLWFIPTGSNTIADKILSYQTKIPKQKIYNGWSSVQWGTLTNQFTAVTISSVDGSPKLYISGLNGVIYRLTTTTNAQGGDTNTYTETSKSIDFGLTDQDKELTDLTVQLASDHVGTLTGTLTFDDGTTAAISAFAGDSAGVTQTVTVPLNLDSLSGMRKLCKDVKVTLQSTSLPAILGLAIRAIPRQFRRTGYNDTVPTSAKTATPVTQDAVTASAVGWI